MIFKVGDVVEMVGWWTETSRGVEDVIPYVVEHVYPDDRVDVRSSMTGEILHVKSAGLCRLGSPRRNSREAFDTRAPTRATGESYLGVDDDERRDTTRGTQVADRDKLRSARLAELLRRAWKGLFRNAGP